ncbi:MAG TPA: tetratricopeptide repeat protein [Candidatus Sulfotelmatobacter sp.]|nr:tetratricopeptide repeat protein [Candidatus Sulfotelmatobacter sp.]
MPVAEPHSGRVRFGAFEADLHAGELRKHGIRIRLQQQPFLVLAEMLEHPGELVTRENLQKKLWPENTFVDFDHGLNKAVSKIRDALGDSAEGPRFVETVARRGYRFLAEVKPVEGAVSSNAGNASRKWFQPFLNWKGLVGVLVLAVAIFAAILQLRGHRPPHIRSLAVLPLDNLAGDQSQDYFADGMTDELITDLGQISALRVISRTSVMPYKKSGKPLLEIAKELGVDAVVEGSVLRSGDRVRITAQLIDAAQDKHLWAQSYEGALGDTLALQSDVARAIADEIRIELNSQEEAALRNVRPVAPQAYDAYLKGRFFWNKRTADGLKAAVDYFNQAIEEDPNYARAYSGLADTYALLGDWQYAVMTPKQAFPLAKAAATKALNLDSSLGEAHNSLAFCLDGFDWNFASAETEFRRAIELNPGYATAHHWYAWHLSLLGHNKEAIDEMKKAQSLDPLSLIINADLAELLLIAHLDDESIQQSRRTLELDANFALAHNQLGQALLRKGLQNDAVLELQAAVRLSGGSPICTANLARAYALSGEKSHAEQLLADLKRQSSPGYSRSSEIAMVYAALGDGDQAMNWLEKGFEDRFNPGVLLRPGFDSLRSDPRFQNLLHRIGMSQ